MENKEAIEFIWGMVALIRDYDSNMDAGPDDFVKTVLEKYPWLEAQTLPLQECYVPKLAPEETPLREDQLDYIKAGEPFVSESTGSKKGWFYSYRDDNFYNQHSEVYPTKDEALKKYFERLDLKLSLPLKEQEDIEALAEENLIKCLDEFKKALQAVERWELPSTGQYWDKEQTQPMSYGAAYGSNGEREYFRHIARTALFSFGGYRAAKKEINQ
jgi:hypothetical protein